MVSTANRPQQGRGFDPVRARIIKKAQKHAPAPCPACGGLGLVLNGPAVCSCVTRVCRCGGGPPYEVYDRERRAFFPCPCKRARSALERYQILLTASGIKSRYSGLFLESMKIPESRRDVLISAREWIISLLDRFAQPSGPGGSGLYLVGGTGSGKTLLACIALNELMLIHQVRSIYCKVSRGFLGRLRDSYNENSEHYGTGGSIEAAVQTVPVLVIDDLGIERHSEWVHRTLYDLIDARWEDELLTIVTSNEPMESWKGLFENRIYSRLRGSCREIKIDGPDLRETLLV